MLRKNLLLIILILSLITITACSSPSPNSTNQTTMTPASKAPQVQSAKNLFFDLINKITGNKSMTKEDLEKIIQTDLLKDEKLSNEYFTIYKAKPTDFFNEIEFRQGNNKFLLILNLSKETGALRISELDVTAKFGKNYVPVPPNPHEGNDIKYLIKYDLPDSGKITFRINKDSSVDSVIIDYID